jgi:hypothetical protein
VRYGALRGRDFFVSIVVVVFLAIVCTLLLEGVEPDLRRERV